MTDSKEQPALPAGPKATLSVHQLLVALVVGLAGGGGLGTYMGGSGSIHAIERTEVRLEKNISTKIEATENKIVGRLDTLSQAVDDHARRLSTLERELREHERGHQ